MRAVSRGKVGVKAAVSQDIFQQPQHSTQFQCSSNQVQLACWKPLNNNKSTPSLLSSVLPPSVFVSRKCPNRVYAPLIWNSSSFKTQMIILKMISSKIIIALIALLVVIGAQSCPQLCASNCTNGTCSSCRTDFRIDAAITNTCSCPAGMFLNTTFGVCLPCPITCSSCVSSSNCLTCIPGFMLSNQWACIPGAQTANGWVSKNISLDFTASQPSGSNFLITVNNTQATQNMTAMGNSCSRMPAFSWLGGYFTYPYSAKVMKSIFSLPPHQWINVRFQAVLIDRWNGNTLLLEMNTYESYNQTAMESPSTIWNGTYNSSQRFLDFCGNSSYPDNLAIADVSIPHNASSIKLRIRLLESDYPFNATSNLNELYYGVREIYVRVGTCGKNCRYCSGPGLCTECALPYTLSNGSCVCNSTFGFATPTGCQANCLAGYYYNSTVKSCLSCEKLVSNCQNCTSSGCSACSLGYFLFSNSTVTLCRRYCPDGFTQTRNVSTIISNQTVYRDQCTACPSNCSTCTGSICFFCMPGYAFYQGSCVQSCPQTTVLGQGSCQSCPLNCLSCTNNVTCATCVSGYGLVNGICTPYCVNSNILSVGNSSVKICNVTCFAGCTNCFGSALNQCLACASGLVLQAGQCISNCSGSYYSFNNSCLPCPSQCATCVNSYYCTSCNNGYLLNFIFCSRLCFAGYYPVVVSINSTSSSLSTNSTQCTSCPTGCLRCKSASFCHECDSRYILFNFTCVQNKPVGFYFDYSFGKFKPCQSNCLQCNQLVCFKCSAGYFLNQGVCVLNCGPDKFPYMRSFYNDSTLLYGFCSWKSPQCIDYDNVTMNGTCNRCSFFQPNLFPVSGLGCRYSCPTFYVQSANGCLPCPQNCRRCTVDMKCLECLYNYVINSIDNITAATAMNSTCVPNYCLSPYFSDSVQCQRCSQGCQVCEIDGRCLTCQAGYQLNQERTACYVYNCTSTQYYNLATYMCQSCISPCVSCISMTTCTSCMSLAGSQMYLYNGQCVLACPDAYFAHYSSGSCRKCHPKCATCSNFYNCLTCNPQFYLLSFYNQDEAQCVSECPVGFWSDTATCQRCYQDCQSCYGPSEYQCLSCYPNFYLDDSKCVWQCSVSKYADHEGYCDWCDPSCLQCNGPTVQNCISCADNYFFYAHTCNINECPDGTFLSIPEMRLCDACQFGCSVCESPQFCRFCFPGYSLYRGWCYLQCPFGLVSRTYRFPYLNQIQGYICTTCLVGYSTNCVECDGNTCTRCNAGFFLYRNSLAIVNVTLKEQCVTYCPLGTYVKSNEERECVNCQTNCLNCTSYQNCVSCISGYNLINGYCTNTCPFGTYLTAFLNCSSCPSTCTSCSSNTSCTSCISGFYLFANSSSNYRSCIQACPTGYFVDSSSGWCKKCLPTCTACNATTTCTQCYSNFTLSNGLCINQTTNNCTANCQLCSGSNCLKCTPPYLLSNSDNNSTCVTICPNGTYSNVFTCEACNSSCVTCQYTSNNCYQCQSGLYLLGQTCVNICPVGYFASTALQTCQSCTANCLNCQQSTCYTCVSGYYLYLGYCFSTCPIKNYPSLSTGQCFSCPTGCNYCTNSSNCTACNSTYMLYNGVCTLICPQTTYSGLSAQGSQACLACPSPCYACTNSSCISCLPGYILNGTICQSSCNSGYYISTTLTQYDDEDPSYNFSTYSQCLPCDSSCTTCVSSSTKCLSCNPPYILFGAQCLNSCPRGTYLNQTICSPCSAYCAACNDSVTCTVCINSTALFSNQCFTTCPAGYFMKLQTNTSLSPYVCQACSPACKTCTGPSQYQCTTCNNQYYSNGNGSCLSTCPRGTYADTLLQLCAPCPYSCSSCTSASNCSSCINNFTLTSTNRCSPTSVCNATNCLYCLTNSTSQCAQCLPNFYLVNATCVTQCPSNTYPSCNKCINCSTGCVSCNVQGCVTCSSTLYLYQGKCYTACPAGTFNVSNVCQSDPCIAYSSVNNDCLSCASPYLLANRSVDTYGEVEQESESQSQDNDHSSSSASTHRMVCVLSCQAGYVKAGSSCVPCPSACTKCISTSICTNCTASAMLYQGSCLYTCPVGTYALNSVCQKCTLPYCIQCTLIGGAQVCTDCEDSSGTFLANGTCVITCPSGTYAIPGSLNCNNCSNNCNQCTALNSCTVCASGFYLYLGQCLTTCPSGTSLSGNSCILCSVGCSQCSSITNCSLCQPSYSLSFSSNGSSCVTVCQPGFYSKSVISTSYTNSNQYQCAACVAPCLTCTSATACTQCVANTSLYQTSCVQSCPQGTYSTISQTVIVNSVSYSASICNPCSTACLTCANTASYCMSCPSGYLLDSNNNCVSNCNSATSYYSSTTRQCYSCSQQCYSCYGPGSDNCLSCRPVLQLFAGSCFSSCPFGYYATSAYICQTCSSSCVTCLGTSTNCTLCNTNLYLQVVNSTGTCVSSCNVGLYINYTSLTCMVCDSTCAACVGISTQCINCPTGFLLYNYRCYATCPAGTTPTFTNSIYRCSTCPSNCANCTFNTTSSRLTCTVCSSGYYLVSGNCSQTCPAGTYSSPSTFTCVTCQLYACQTCTYNSSLMVSCSACQAGYFILNGACYSTCPTGTVASGAQCIVQPTCQGYQFLGFCFNVCPAATYATNVSVTTSGVVTFTLGCNNCSSFCSNCLSASLCIQCISNTYLYTTSINGTLQSTCVNACPSGFYSALSVCLACASPCLTCQQTTTGISCLTCQAGFYHLNSVCYTTCPIGYYANGTICLQCSSVCSACSGSASNCTICKNVLTLAPNCASSANCSSGQYLSGNATCSACNSACLTCYGGSSYECSSCANSSNVLVNGFCMASCAAGTMLYQSTCVSCPTNCLTCNMTNTTFACTSCASPYILAGISGCVLSCSALNTATASYNLVNGTCQHCNISGCLICSVTSNSTLQCTTCNNASFLYNQACYSVCPTGTMASYNPNTCASCPQNCTSCSSTYCFKCATGLMLLNGVCVTNCGSGYYNSNGTCYQCSVSNCLSCSSSGCLACQQPYLLASGSCSSCISGYYNSYGTCYICTSPCLTCSGYSTTCTSCVSSYFLTNNTCVQTCPTGFYISSSTCVACTVSNCQTCTSTGCSSCMTGYYSYYQSNQTTCVSACPSGTYAISTFPSCNTCSALCITCTSASSCLTCQSPAVLYQGYCLSTCPSGSTNVNQTCVSCLSGCKTCTTLTNCTSCNTGLVANANGTCTAPISNCSAGYYLNALRNCSQCFSTCMTCSGGGSFDCLSCFTGYLLVNGVCTQSCNSDSFYSNTTSSCQLCSTLIANCVSCTSTSCLSCATNYTVSNGSCTRSCPSSTYLSNGVCNSCPNYCLTCSSSSSCSSCLNTTFILMNGLCYSSCPDQTYLSNNACTSCYQTCLTCSGTSTNCSSCITPYNLYGSSCLATCPNGTFSSNYTCQNCSSNCALCSDINTCTLCSGSFYLMNGTCRSTCLTGYYIDTTSNRCIQCPSPCLICSSRTNCTSCQSPSTLNNGMCINSNCSSGYYNYTVNLCVNCTINHCVYCTNSSCSYCASGYYSIYQNGVLTYCEPGCLSGTYPDNATMNCTSCFTNCFSCISTTWCSICKAGYYLLTIQGANANQCVTSCPPGYYINNSTLSCSSCSNNCETCTSANVCTDCANNYYLYVTSSSTTCVSNCPTSYFNPTVLDGSGSCGQCASNCYTCSDAQTCTQCVSSSFVIINGVCTPSNCVHCLVCNSTANACNTCIAGYYSFNSACLASCPDNYYADNSTQSCQSCTTNCLLCTQSTDCLLCISGYVFVNGTGCQNAGLIKFGVLGNMSGFTSNITKIMSIVYVSTSAGPIAFGAIGSTYGPMQFCQFMYLLQGSTGGNEEVTNFLNSMSSVSYTTNSGTGSTANNQVTGNSTASTARLLTAISYTSSFLETNYPVFLIMLAFICSYFLVLILDKYNQSCCLSCPTLLKYISYTCDFMKKRFKFIYVDCVMWISYLPFLYFAILQLQIGKFDSGINVFSSLLAIVIIIVYPLYPFFILRKLFDRSDNPMENLVNYKAITLKAPLREEQGKPLCEDFTCCPKENPNIAMMEMSLSPYIEKVVRPIYNEHDPDYNEFRYFTIPHFRLAYAAIKYVRKFIYVMIVALCPNPVTTLSLLVVVTLLYIVYLIALKPKEKLYLVLEIILECVLLFFVTFMLVYVSVGGANVSYLSIVTHAIGFIIANSTLAIAIILNIMSYYTIFCCIVDLLKHIRNKKIEEENPVIPDEKEFQIENIHDPEDVDGTGEFTLEKEQKGRFNDKEDLELRKSNKRGDDEMTVENNDQEQYVPYDLDEKEFNVRSSMVNKKKKTFEDDLPEEAFDNLKSTKNPKAKRDRRAERKKESNHLEEASHTSEEIMGQSKLSTEQINDGLLKDKNSKYKREVNKNDVNVNRGELREPTNNFRRNKNLKDGNPNEQESMDTLMRPEGGKKRSNFSQPFDEFAAEIDTHERMVPGKFDGDVDPKFAERQAKRKQKKDDYLNPMDEPYMRERQGNSKNFKPNDLDEGNMYDRQGKLRENRSGKEPQSGNMYQRDNKKRINNNFNDNGFEEVTGKERIKRAKEEQLNANNNDMFEVIGKDRNKDRVGEGNMYDRQGKPKNQKDANRERDLENANMVEKNKKRQDNLFGEFEEIFDEVKPGVKDANMKERQRQNKEKSLNEENLLSGFLAEPNTVERKPQARKLENLHYKGSSEEEGVIKEGQVVEAQTKFKRNIKQKPSDNVPEGDINAYGKDIKTKKVEKIVSSKEFAEDTPEEARYKERQAKEINKAKSYNERAQSQDVEEVSAYNREKKAMEKKKKEAQQKIEDVNLLSVNPKIQQKQKSKKQNIYDDVDNELAESIEFKIEKPKQKRSNEPEDDFEQSEMGKNIKAKEAKKNRRGDRRLEVSENIEESYDDVVKKNKEIMFKQKQGGKSQNLLEIEDDFEEENYQRPPSKISRPSSRSKDGGLGVNSRAEEGSDNESSIRKQRASAIQRQRSKGNMKVNDNELNVDESQVAADQRKKSRIVAPKSNRIRGVLNIDDKSDDDNLEQLKF